MLIKNKSLKYIVGFTLLELLIALFIFTLVAVILTGILHTVFTAQSATEKQSNRLASLQIAMLLLSRDVEQIINRPIYNAKNLTEPAIIGTPTSLTFTHGGFANPQSQLPRSTLQRTQYSLENNYFIRSTWAVLDQTSHSLPAKRILLSRVTDLQFEYLDDHNQFQQNWPPADKKTAIFPRGIRVSLTLAKWGKLSQFYFLPQENIPSEQTGQYRGK